jgi:ketosteroid isomerase-like protein
MAHPNADLVRRGFEAFAAGDMATLDEIMSDDVKWHSMGAAPFAGDVEGKQAVFANWATIPSVVDSMRQDLHAIVADDEHAVAMVNLEMTRGDRTFSGGQIIVFHVADGKATEGWVVSVDQAEADAFWAD